MAYSKDWIALVLILCATIISTSLLSGCASSGEGPLDTDASTASQASRFSGTNPPYPESTNTPNDKDDFNTRVAQHLAAIATDAALSPHPTPPQGPVYLEGPIPSPTWTTGYFGWVMPPNTINPEYVSCWHGYLNDKLLRLCAGHEQQGGDPQQGVLQVKVIELDQVTVISNDVYETPGAFGVVHIVVAGSNSVTIASDDGRAVYTFSIVTRQWVPNPPSVLPTDSP
jgi:hypothetical protein